MSIYLSVLQHIAHYVIPYTGDTFLPQSNTSNHPLEFTKTTCLLDFGHVRILEWIPIGTINSIILYNIALTDAFNLY